jgi:hypothetical protein
MSPPASIAVLAVVQFSADSKQIFHRSTIDFRAADPKVRRVLFQTILRCFGSG